MVLDHIGIINSNEDLAVKFYCRILGLDKIRDSVVPAELAVQLFSCQSDIKMIVFGKDNVKVEVFILPGARPPSRGVPHFCLIVPDLSEFLARVRQNGVNVVSGSFREKTVHFIEDFSGNRIEIKPA